VKVAAAQCASKPGDIVANVRRHVAVVERAAPLEADAVVFPELSLIGYEPRFAAATATAPEDPRFAPLQAASERCGILVAVGAPLETPDLPRIATQIFLFFVPGIVFLRTTQASGFRCRATSRSRNPSIRWERSSAITTSGPCGPWPSTDGVSSTLNACSPSLATCASNPFSPMKAASAWHSAGSLSTIRARGRRNDTEGLPRGKVA